MRFLSIVPVLLLLVSIGLAAFFIYDKFSNEHRSDTMPRHFENYTMAPPPTTAEPFEKRIVMLDGMFRLEHGIEEHVEVAKTGHEHAIQVTIGNGSVIVPYDAASAITEYFSAVTNMTRLDVKDFIIGYIARFIVDNDCPQWNSELIEPVMYKFCDCSTLTIKDWQALNDLHVQETNDTLNLDKTLTVNLLHEVTIRREYECNRGFAWSLLTMLFVQYGPEVGLQYFRNSTSEGEEGLYWDAARLTQNKTATKLELAKAFMRLIEKHLHAGEAHTHYYTMELIVAALNGMTDFLWSATYLDRLQQSLLKQQGMGGVCKDWTREIITAAYFVALVPAMYWVWKCYVRFLWAAWDEDPSPLRPPHILEV